ncbi:MAG TPA: dienelactone hydrolase family protein, partial [Acidimicrobiales bacterium]
GMSPPSAGTGYLARPDSGEGPGVLVLHSWWGLTPFFRDVCDRLAVEGFVALAPDLFGGELLDDAEQARARLAAADMNAMLDLVRSSLLTLRGVPVTPDGPVGTLGCSMGASWALWLASRLPDAVGATVVFYGAQNVDMAPATSPFLGHFADVDDVIDADEVVLLEADLRLLDKDVTFHRYTGTSHWFFEADRPEHDPDAAAVAWERTTAFLHRHLDPRAAGGEGDDPPAPGDG